MVYKAMEDGADLIIKQEKDMPTPEIAEEETTLVPEL